MNSELSKTISTCTIWLATACILTFGVFKLNVNGEIAVLLLLFCMPAAILVAAVMATKVIWASCQENKTPANSATASNPPPSAIKS